MLVEFSIEGEKQLARRFRGISISVMNWSSVMGEIGKELTETFSGPVFETRGAEIGEPWESRKKSYAWPLLEKTGEMRKGFRYKSGKDSVEVFNIVNYFSFHQSRELPRRKLPRRIMMKLDDKRKEMIMKKIHYRLIKKIK